jgi:hypothetical protein
VFILFAVLFKPKAGGGTIGETAPAGAPA